MKIYEERIPVRIVGVATDIGSMNMCQTENVILGRKGLFEGRLKVNGYGSGSIYLDKELMVAHNGQIKMTRMFYFYAYELKLEVL